MSALSGSISSRSSSSRSSSCRSEVAAAEMVAPATGDVIFVAVGKDEKECKLALDWTVQKFGAKRLCLLHVHVPDQMVSMEGTNFRLSSSYQQTEKKKMQKILDGYLLICRRMGIQAEELHIEKDSIEMGIVELITENNIRTLVMGAAKEKCYSRKMLDLKSKKAIYVRERAPDFCQIYFICKGHFIHARASKLDKTNAIVKHVTMQPSPNLEIEDPNHMRSQSVNSRPSNQQLPTFPNQEIYRLMRSTNIEKSRPSTVDNSSLDGTEWLSSPTNGKNMESVYDVWAGFPMGSQSTGSTNSTFSSSPMADMAFAPISNERSEIPSETIRCSLSKDDFNHSSAPNVLNGSMDESLYEHVELALSKVEKAERRAYDEGVKRGKAEKDAITAMRRAKASDFLYGEELKRRKEVEESLAKEREKLDAMKKHRDEVIEELRAAKAQISSLQLQIAELGTLEQKFFSAIELLEKYKKERDEMRIERDNALREAEEQRKEGREGMSSHVFQFFSEFSLSEIEGATKNFDPLSKIGEGGYGSIYKGLLRNTQVAVKILHTHSLQGPSEFQQEVDVLSKLRHPNLVTLIGACPEAWALVYEYLPNGSLEDRLSRKNNSSPLPWQMRIRIAAELCSVLVFLHSSKPHGVVHGDLKPSNILLDANFVTKLSDFGICRLLFRDKSSGNGDDDVADTAATVFCRTDHPKGTLPYMDPEFLSSGELTLKSDVYSFGIILLQLLTGKPAVRISKEVQNALDQDKLQTVLDPVAGDWPFVQAEQLARLALRCCEVNRKSRPDLGSDVWRVLEPMRAFTGGSSSFPLGSGDNLEPPPHFVCPIFQEVMRDPHMAADGFTYEAEALKGWLDSGHMTSPMTNLKLEHCNLVPNHALRSAIQEWLQQH